MTVATKDVSTVWLYQRYDCISYVTTCAHYMTVSICKNPVILTVIIYAKVVGLSAQLIHHNIQKRLGGGGLYTHVQITRGFPLKKMQVQMSESWTTLHVKFKGKSYCIHKTLLYVT